MSDWFPGLPFGWEETRLDRVAVAWPSNVDKHTVEGQPLVRLCNYTDVYKNDRITADMDFMVASATTDQIERFRLRRGDTIITKDSETAEDIGAPAFVDAQSDDLICGYHLAMVRPRGNVEPRFLYWALNSAPTMRQWALAATGVTRVGIKSSELSRLRLALPRSRAKQQRIANYLDRETAQIDTLISEQEHLLEVLAERRQAAIAEAVMPSGNPLNDAVGWPRIAHGWDVSLGKMLDAGKPAPVESASLPYVRAGNIQDHGLDLASVNEMAFTPEEATQFDLRAGDLLVVEGGAVGTNVTLTEDMLGWAFQKTVNRARPVSGGDSRWLGYVLRTYRDSGVLDIVCNKSTIAHLTAEKLRGLAVPPCSNSDQKRIADLLDAALARLDDLSREATRCIKLARERRAALITAAVTGQIEIPEG